MQSASKNVSLLSRTLPGQLRAYATEAPATEVVKKIQYRKPSRVYGDRKSHLHAQYANLLHSNDVLLLVRYDNVKVNALNKLRRDIAAAASKAAKASSSSKGLLNPAPTANASSSSSPPPPAAAVTFIRPGVFTASLRTRFDEATVQRAAKTLRGSYALISARELNPPLLASLIRVIDPRRGPVNPDDIEDAPPKVKAPPSIRLVAGVVEDRFFLTEDVVGVSKLPTLQTLHAQIVGLLSAPAAKLSQVLGAAAGGSLLRTLQGYEKGLQEEQAESSKTPSSSS
ncbi:hypothetical protein DL93DRAFT_2111613 [Clavulina sp. PMI_390]|nr:hypothetical protein DL93DRAFT_2111613 [Clavulina sp. PMI_390]